MTVAEVAASGTRSHCKKLMKFGLSIFRIGFNSSKCKTMAKMAVARIKLLRNKRQVVVKQMRRDVALLLQSGQDATARIRVEHVIREQNIMAANEFLELFCDLVVARLSIISKRRECPEDLKEGISSLIFAAPRCSDIPELSAIRDIFEKKYGKDFVSAATDLRPSCGVNRMLIDKLSVRTPTGEVKLKVMKEIAKEYQIEWDTTESEMELLKPPEELIEGPKTFVSATSMPVKLATKSVEPNMHMARSIYGGERDTMQFENTASAAESANQAIAAAQAAAYLANRDGNQVTQAHGYENNFNPSSMNQGCGGNFSGNSTGHFIPNNHLDTSPNTGHQAEVLRRQSESQSFERSYSTSNEVNRPSNINGYENNFNSSSMNQGCAGNFSGNSTAHFIPNNHLDTSPNTGHQAEVLRRQSESQSFERSYYTSNEVNRPSNINGNKVQRRHSYNVPPTRTDVQFDSPTPTFYQKKSPTPTDIQFDDSDCDEEIEMEEPPSGTYLPPDRPPPSLPSVNVKPDPVPRTHPKLPDYDALAARFEALKHRKSQK